MKIAFRVDAALHIGAGHVMRCLTLANALKQEGAACVFICKKHQGNLVSYIEEQGFRCVALSAPSKLIENQPNAELKPPHAAWLGDSWEADLQQTFDAIAEETFDVLVVDNYALDARWENGMRHKARRILVIDDLADRKHDCDILLDQTLGRNAEDYRALVPNECTLLMGVQYALLRPEFAKWREYSLARRKNAPSKKLLVNMGGVDGANVTSDILKALQHCALPPDIAITVVMGSTAPHLAEVKQIAEQMPWQTEVLVGVNNMAEIMANSDLAIGAAGATSWERCCLGLPTLLVALAENQRKIAKELELRMAVFVIDENDIIANRLDKLFSMFKKTSGLYVENAAGICDGTGVPNIINYLKIV